MKKLLILGTASSALFAAAAANTAELPLKASATLASTSPWTGFYLGAGLGFRSSGTHETFTSETVAGNPVPNQPLAANNEPLDGVAFRGSSYIGYNWQAASRWVLGIEGDIGFAKQTTTFAGLPFPDQTLSTFLAADGIAAKTKWDASARGRLGFLVTPATLVYATGGAAWQHYGVSTTCASALCATSFLGPPFQFTPTVTNNSATKVGWTVGAGIETALWGNWIARADYRYSDLGTSTFAIARVSSVPQLGTIVNSFDVSLRTNTVTFGVAYKFGDPIAAPSSSGGWLDALPAKALPVKAAPVAVSWSGLYGGVGLGVRATRSEATTTFTGASFFTLDLRQLAARQPLNGTALRGNPYLGLNWQIAPRWVVGIEGDVGVADQSTALLGLAFSPGVPFNANTRDESFVLHTSWDASIRGRVGLLVTPTTLAYATGGAAWQHFEVTSNCGPIGCGGFQPAVIRNDATKAGWVVGGGAETMLSGNWFTRADYRYADYGISAFTINRLGLTDNFNVALRTHTATFGLSYKFSGLGGPLVARY